MNLWKRWCKREIDERQQADLNRVTGYGYWIAFWLLLAAFVVEAVFLKRPVPEWIVEWGIFMILAVYEVAACIRIGVWSEGRQNVGWKDLIRYSLIGSFLFSVIMTAGSCLGMGEEGRSVKDLAVLFGAFFVPMAILMLAGLFVAWKLLKWRRRKLEEAFAEESEDEENK